MSANSVLWSRHCWNSMMCCHYLPDGLTDNWQNSNFSLQFPYCREILTKIKKILKINKSVNLNKKKCCLHNNFFDHMNNLKICLGPIENFININKKF